MSEPQGLFWEGEYALPGVHRAAFRKMNERFLSALRKHHGAQSVAIPPRPSAKKERAVPLPKPVAVTARHQPSAPLSVHLLDDLDEAELVQIRSILRRDSVRRVVEAIATRTGIPAVRIVSQSRNQACVAARHWAFFELQQAGFSLTQIGRMFKKDHTTILHGIRKHISRTGAAKLEAA